MAVPSSGELKLWDDLWNQEIGGSKGNNSLHSASVYAEFDTPDALGDFYGWSDVEVPSVSSLNATSVNYNSAILRGEVTATGNEDVSSGFYIGTSNTAASNPKVTLPGTRGTGVYCCTKTGLTGQTSYKSFAFASNSAGECIATSCCTFTTPVPPFNPSLTTWYAGSAGSIHRVSNIGTNIAQSTGAGYALNPYTSGWQAIFTTPTANQTSATCTGTKQGATNANNKWCHWGSMCAYYQSEVKSTVCSNHQAGQNWCCVFPPGGNFPDKFYTTSFGNAGAIQDPNSGQEKVEFCGRKGFPSHGRPQTINFDGYFCFPSL